MPLRIGCENCGRLLTLKDELAGKRIRCPHCKTVQVVPTAGATEEPPPDPAEPPLSREDALAQVAVLSAAKAARKRLIRLTLLFALPGLIYGLVSAYMNQNPFYAWFRPTVNHISKIQPAWEWQPSPAWPLSYLLTQAKVGMQYERGPGYHFRSFFDWLVFYVASGLLGALPCAALGAAVAGLLRLGGKKLSGTPPPELAA